MWAATRLGITAGTAGQYGLAAHPPGVHRAERWRGEGGEHARVRRDGLGDALAPGQARADQLPGVPLVGGRTRGANGLAAVPALGGDLAVEGGEFAGGQVDHVGAVAELDRVGAGAVGGELVFPGAEVCPGGGGVVGGRPRSRAGERFGTQGGCRGGHEVRPQRCWGGLAADAEPGADLGPGVAEAAQAGDGLADSRCRSRRTGRA